MAIEEGWLLLVVAAVQKVCLKRMLKKKRVWLPSTQKLRSFIQFIVSKLVQVVSELFNIGIGIGIW